MVSKKYLRTVFIGICLTEAMCATYFLEIGHAAAFFSMAYFIAGIGIGILLLFLPPIHRPDVPSLRQHYGAEFFFKILLIAALAFYLFHASKTVFAENPLDYRNADMLPVIKIMNQRFLSGEWKQVYDNIPG